jgi:predicted 3-demethylubiquinone-9 3-methyltransferase (glyoxalase superfamily)
MSAKQKIMTTLWFNGNAEEAINFYVSLFKNSRINSIHHYGKSSKGGKEGEVNYLFLFKF